MDHRTSPIRLRLQRVREALAQLEISAVLVPSSDPHLSEYLPARWQCREWLSGFTGSTATLVVTADCAALFADSRYWVQAEVELAGTGIELVQIPTGAAVHHIEWIARELPLGSILAVDGNVLAISAAQALHAGVDKAGISLRTDLDLFEMVWPERPALPMAPVYEHTAPQAPLPRADKLSQVREAMASHGAAHHFVSTTDDIAWLLNLRGSDVNYNPVFLAHLLINPSDATLFVADGKVPGELCSVLAVDGVRLKPYSEAGPSLAALHAGATLLLDPRRVTLGLREHVGNSTVVIEDINPSTLLKSRKNAAEAAHVRETMAQDGAAMCEFYAWFEQALADTNRKTPLTELTVDEQLSAARARRPGFVSLSFPTIAGFRANGAMPHYRATEASHATLDGDGLLLIDSGGQYVGGTTDITRVWPIGNVSSAQRRDYTLVLKGMLALSRTRFPRDTLSPMLDAIARAPLWEHGLNYGHGTGHGVGYFLNVHEGPQSISKVIPESHMAMVPGMITSIEPGLYRAGQWGIRIENLVLNVPCASPDVTNEFGEFLEFETLTLCPIDTRCIDPSLMHADEVAWLNRYHAMVRERLSPLVDGDALAWLLARTAPI